MTESSPPLAVEVRGFVFAFAAAAAATILDSYFTMAKSVSGTIIAHPAILALSVLCGALAVLAFALTDPAGTDLISTAITLKQTNPILRGFSVGAMVLVLIRSKLFNSRTAGWTGRRSTPYCVRSPFSP